MDPGNVDAVIQDLQRELIASIVRGSARTILLSGGIDSSLLAMMDPKLECGIVVNFAGCGIDPGMAKVIGERRGLEIHERSVTVEEAIEAIPEIVGTLKTFDPVIPNNLVLMFGLKQAKEIGYNVVETGDGGDELFAGYSYMWDKDLEVVIPELAAHMSFESIDVGKSLGVDVFQPYTDPSFIEFALGIDPGLKVVVEDGKVWGKWILRKTLEQVVPPIIAWRSKMPLETGSGMSELRSIIEEEVPGKELERARKDYGIDFMSREHVYYYESYREVVGEIPEPVEGEKPCPSCGAGVALGKKHCRVCGAFPV
jgi:asparagine synthase (glutamine-hydrolysing)